MNDIYYASAEEMAKLDDIAVSGGLEIRQMMELAGWHMVQLYRQIGVKNDSKTAIIIGKGNKGGDGLSAARHLVNFGYSVNVFLLEEEISQDARHHLDMTQRMNIPTTQYKGHSLSDYDVIIDAMVGYRMKNKLVNLYLEATRESNKSSAVTIAYDVPTGVKATKGDIDGESIKADYTLMLALAKSSITNPDAKSKFGKVVLTDIGIPTYMYDQISVGSRPNFEASGLLPLEISE